MVTELPPPLLLLLHEGGWDEVIMVAIGLGLAYLVIMWTGRRSNQDDDEEDEADEDGGEGEASEVSSTQPSAAHDDTARPRP